MLKINVFLDHFGNILVIPIASSNKIANLAKKYNLTYDNVRIVLHPDCDQWEKFLAEFCLDAADLYESRSFLVSDKTFVRWLKTINTKSYELAKLF